MTMIFHGEGVVMNRRQFLGLVAGISAARVLPSYMLAAPATSKCSICGEPIWAGEEVIKQGGPHVGCARDVHPHYWWGPNGIYMLARIQGNLKPGDLVYWDRSTNKKGVVQSIDFKDEKAKGWLCMAGSFESRINETGWGWIRVKF